MSAAGPSLHYEFAHIALRGIALNEGAKLYQTLSGERGRDLIDVLLKAGADRLSIAQHISSGDIGLHDRTVNGRACMIVEMPEPQEAVHAHFVAILLGEADDDPARYITLERSVSLDAGAQRTVLAEWSTEGHVNYGDGPEPTIDAFVDQLSAMIG